MIYNNDLSGIIYIYIVYIYAKVLHKYTYKYLCKSLQRLVLVGFFLETKYFQFSLSIMIITKHLDDVTSEISSSMIIPVMRKQVPL